MACAFNIFQSSSDDIQFLDFNSILKDNYFPRLHMYQRNDEKW